MKLGLTVLTDPISWGRDFWYEQAKSFIKSIKNLSIQKNNNLNLINYRGHPAVTRSLIEGLKKINASFNYNPAFPNMSETVVVLSGIRTLKQAIRLKRDGFIKKLIVGPNVVNFASDYNSVLSSTEIDIVLTPSDWVSSLYLLDAPELSSRIFSWPAGVDANYWKRVSIVDREKILIFDKRSIKNSDKRIEPFKNYLITKGWEVNVLERNASISYSREKYLHLLNESCLMIGFTVGHESQGIAWAEAWSCDVPTMIERGELDFQDGRRFACSTAPYLTKQSGIFFDNLDDFKNKFEIWEKNPRIFSPREWVLDNLTDEICASKLLDIVKN